MTTYLILTGNSSILPSDDIEKTKQWIQGMQAAS